MSNFLSAEGAIKMENEIMHRVRATREALQGHITASGWRIDDQRLFVALPSRKALHRRIEISNPANGKICEAEVLDVGPWNIHDDDYVFGSQRPAAESGWHVSRDGELLHGETNGAGIDLGEAVWKALGMTDNVDVDWRFVE